MKYLFALLILVALCGSAFAEEATLNATEPPAAAATAVEPAAKPDAAAAQDAAVMPAELTTAETPNDEPERKRTAFALTLGQYMPVDSQVKSVFGTGGLWRIGIRPLPTNAPNGTRFACDLNWISMKSNNGSNKANLIPLTAGLLFRFGKENMRSYASLYAGPYYGTAKVPAMGIDKKGWGWDTNITIGTIFKERYSLEARYDFMNKFAGLDFSSFSVSVAMRLFTAKL